MKIERFGRSIKSQIGSDDLLTFYVAVGTLLSYQLLLSILNWSLTSNKLYAIVLVEGLKLGIVVMLILHQNPLSSEKINSQIPILIMLIASALVSPFTFLLI
jgi:hypothetical protein